MNSISVAASFNTLAPHPHVARMYRGNQFHALKFPGSQNLYHAALFILTRSILRRDAKSILDPFGERIRLKHLILRWYMAISFMASKFLGSQNLYRAASFYFDVIHSSRRQIYIGFIWWHFKRLDTSSSCYDDIGQSYRWFF